MPEQAARRRWRGPFGRLEWTVLALAAATAVTTAAAWRGGGDDLPGYHVIAQGAAALDAVGQQVFNTGVRGGLASLGEHGSAAWQAAQAARPGATSSVSENPAQFPTAAVQSMDQTVAPGGQFHLAVVVHNPNPQPVAVGLGVSLVPLDGRPMFSDPTHDLVRAPIPPGDATLRRTFAVPAGTPPGRYGVWIALYDHTFPQHPPAHVYADLGMYRYTVTVRS